jgi:hypothetical protein
MSYITMIHLISALCLLFDHDAHSLAGGQWLDSTDSKASPRPAQVACCQMPQIARLTAEKMQVATGTNE